MSLSNPSGGYNNSSEYQMAGLPWCYTATSGARVRLDFPCVSRSITIANNGTTSTNTIVVSFSEYTGSANTKFTIPAATVVELPLRIKTMWVEAGSGTPQFSVLAALTTVPAHHMPLLTGSQWQGI